MENVGGANINIEFIEFTGIAQLTISGVVQSNKEFRLAHIKILAREGVCNDSVHDILGDDIAMVWYTRLISLWIF